MTEKSKHDSGARLRAGDADAWRQFIASEIPKLYAMFLKKLGNPSLAEELVQKTIFDAVKGRTSFNSAKGSAEQWVFGIARNNIRLEFRTRASRPSVNGDMSTYLEVIDTELLPDELLERKETAAMVQEAIRTPICLGASITTPAQAEMALELKSAQAINIIPGRVGGLGPAKAIYDSCRTEGVVCWVGGSLQTAIGVRASLALASLEHCGYPAEFLPPAEWFEEDLAEGPATQRHAEDGKLSVALWPEPGIGVVPRVELLERYCVEQAKC